MKNRKRLLTVAALVLTVSAICAAGLLVYFKIEETRVKDSISRAEAAKMITGAFEADMDSFKGENNWYEKYVSYVNQKGYMKITKPDKEVTYSDLKAFLEALGKTPSELGIKEQKDGQIIKKNDFINIYIDLIDLMDKESRVFTLEAGVFGTDKDAGVANGTKVYTNKGIFDYAGIDIKAADGKLGYFLVNGSTILCMQRTADTSVTFENVLVPEINGSKVSLYYDGLKREFEYSGLKSDQTGKIADVDMASGKITSVRLKEDISNGRVLAIADSYVEIEGRGVIPFESGYRFYNTTGSISEAGWKDIIPGYSLQDLAIENGKLCGAVINRNIKPDKIRVLIKNSGFESIYHEYAEISADSDFTVTYGNVSEKHAAKEVVKINKDSAMFKQGRVKIEASAGQLKIVSVKRDQGTPVYDGTIEMLRSDSGITIINETGIENYLKKVVPGEMYVNYGYEALRVQAVCARSYAISHMQNNAYLKYGAHLDDSTQYQVYNNQNESPVSNQAVMDTAGEVVTYNGQAIEALYYSTSCGYTTDAGIWGSDSLAYPYYTAHCVSQNETVLDLSDEEVFKSFIKSSDYRDFDKDATLYRWKWEITADQLSKSFNEKLPDRYKLYPDNILTLNQSTGNFESKNISTVGKIKEIRTGKRIAGGALTSIVITGTEATVKIDGENIIRYMMSVSNKPLSATNGNLISMSSLPSTFCIFEPVTVNNEVTGFVITGGGYGHGVGMSQSAVYSMCVRDWKYADILKYFYAGTEIGKLY